MGVHKAHKEHKRLNSATKSHRFPTKSHRSRNNPKSPKFPIKHPRFRIKRLKCQTRSPKFPTKPPRSLKFNCQSNSRKFPTRSRRCQCNRTEEMKDLQNNANCKNIPVTSNESICIILRYQINSSATK